ncbi:GNAT family N-acetyltransferase [Tengunoibacter tsumagoiensis]|uniref:GNAT family N-acetyltransferase n=1 Tax=Tengunoibacter tsumagoiensis TaxID=2014871 RepID=A0A402A3U0_9CHLR|nr:GNAT family N-acetyltransferase [Tengunoibacter tsumagoiensis]GCE13814.1 GNAT family N-acetyltransferase [Tengunoibacter tsumagoiensis]
MLILSEPSEQYKQSFLVGLLEFQAEGRMLEYNFQRVSSDFRHFLQQFQGRRDPRLFSPQRVQATDFWLIDDEEYIGTVSIRPELNETLLRIGGHIGYKVRPSRRLQGYGTQLLRLGLEKAREMGLRRVLITCDETNVASRKVIEANGGQFENALVPTGSTVPRRRYWIELAS